VRTALTKATIRGAPSRINRGPPSRASVVDAKPINVKQAAEALRNKMSSPPPEVSKVSTTSSSIQSQNLENNSKNQMKLQTKTLVLQYQVLPVRM